MSEEENIENQEGEPQEETPEAKQEKPKQETSEEEEPSSMMKYEFIEDIPGKEIACRPCPVAFRKNSGDGMIARDK